MEYFILSRIIICMGLEIMVYWRRLISEARKITGISYPWKAVNLNIQRSGKFNFQRNLPYIEPYFCKERRKVFIWCNTNFNALTPAQTRSKLCVKVRLTFSITWPEKLTLKIIAALI